MTDWVRLWHDMPTDPKWRVIARRSGQPLTAVLATFTMLMVEASRVADRGCVAGWRHEDAAAALDMEEADVASIVDAMQGRVIIDARLSGWDRRQPKREDGSAERVAAHRKRKAEAAKRDVTHGNAPETDTDTDTDTDIPEADASGPAAPAAPAIDFCKAVFDSGRAILTRSGMDGRQAGSLIGRWRKKLGDPELLTLIRQSEADGHSDPAAWLSAAVEQRNGTDRSYRGTAGREPDGFTNALRRASAKLEANHLV